VVPKARSVRGALFVHFTGSVPFWFWQAASEVGEKEQNKLLSKKDNTENKTSQNQACPFIFIKMVLHDD
jgi:hypothetical protein